MIWQDLVIAVAQVIFAVALLPSIFTKDKPAVATSIMNFVVLYIISYVNYTLNLVGAAAGLFIVATLWAVLAVQKYLRDKRKS